MMRRFDYQSDQHCAKTEWDGSIPESKFDYQSDQHCAKTSSATAGPTMRFDYQSDQHCAKTRAGGASGKACLITSQINTAPKQKDVGQIAAMV